LFGGTKARQLDVDKKLYIRKPKFKNVFTAVFSIACLVAFTYIALINDGWIFLLGFIFVPLALFFCIHSIKGALDTSVQIQMDEIGITFCGKETIAWVDIKNTFIEIKSYYLAQKSNDATIEKFYLNIETFYSGKFTNRQGLRSFEITGLALSASEISHWVELYRKTFSGKT